MSNVSAVPVPASHLAAARDADPATRAANAAMAAAFLMALAGRAACTMIAISFLPNERDVTSTALKRAE